MSLQKSISTWVVGLSLSLGASGKVIYVDVEATGRNDGTSWPDAFVSLQEALRSSQAPDEIWVAEGIYWATNDGDRSVSFVPLSGVSLYGGFGGEERRREMRNWLAHPTVLSADIGEQWRHRDNTQRLVELVDKSTPVQIDGFVLRGAFNERNAPLGRGGAFYVLRSTVTIANCEIRRNRAGGGGAMWIEDSTMSVENCLIRNNRNRAVSSTMVSDVTFVDCRFEKNRVTTDGGAIGAFNGSRTTAVNCVFIGNAAAQRDGGAYYGRDEGRFVGCVFLGNTAGEWGGALRQWSGPLTVINCSFTSNHTKWWGAGISALDACTIANSTFHGNTGDRGSGEDAQIDFFETLPMITNCLVEGWTGRWGGEGNFDADPKWVDAPGGNLRLAHDSPCIDAGTDDAVTEAIDLDGNPRILGSRVDIGA